MLAAVVAGPVLVTFCVYVTLLPAATEPADAVFVVTRFDCVAVATTSLAVALLLPRFGSVTADVTLAVSLICVPAAVPAFTFSTTVKVEDPGAKLAFVQLMAPVPFTAGVVQDQPAGVVIDWKEVLAGVFSVMLAAVAVLGPPLVTTCV